MKKDDLKKSISNINPDIYMCNRLKEKIFSSATPVKKSKQIAKCTTAFIIVFAIVFSIGFLSPSEKVPTPQKNATVNTVQQNKIANPFIMIASAVNSGNSEFPTESRLLELSKEYPCEVYLEVKDIRGLTNDEISKTVKELDNIFKKYCNENNVNTAMASVCSTENIALSQCTLNSFKLVLDDIENIKSINVKNTSKYGSMTYYQSSNYETTMHKRGNDFTINSTDFDFENGCFFWDHTDEMEKAFDENINTAFSTFNDTITFTVEYNDGSKTIGVVELIFDENGSASAICKNYDYIPAQV